MEDYSMEFYLSLTYFFFSPFVYFFWLKPRITDAVQVFSEYLLIHKGDHKEEIKFSEIQSINTFAGSLFCIVNKEGKKIFFSSDLERVDYVWEGLFAARSDLIPHKLFEEFRINLVKSDHHQKRKEWFLKHRFIDVVSWVIMPTLFLGVSYWIQSREIMIHHQGLYFFRLFMYALLTMLVTSLVYSLLLKKFVFDRRFDEHEHNDHGPERSDKMRDLEFEGIIIQRSKVFQLIISSFMLSFVIKSDFNFISLSRAKADLANFDIPAGKTMIIDNRYNCTHCRYKLNDGDMVMFGVGMVGQILAKEGDPIGQVLQDTKGRTIASLNVHEVPKGHVAVKTANNKDIIFIKVVDLIGKIQK